MSRQMLETIASKIGNIMFQLSEAVRTLNNINYQLLSIEDAATIRTLLTYFKTFDCFLFHHNILCPQQDTIRINFAASCAQHHARLLLRESMGETVQVDFSYIQECLNNIQNEISAIWQSWTIIIRPKMPCLREKYYTLLRMSLALECPYNHQCMVRPFQFDHRPHLARLYRKLAACYDPKLWTQV